MLGMLFSQRATADVPGRTLLGQPAGAGLKFNVSFLINSAESARRNDRAASLGLVRAGAHRAGAGQQLRVLTNPTDCGDQTELWFVLLLVSRSLGL